MRRIAVVLLSLVFAGANVAAAAAEAWLTIGGADGSFQIEMPVPFDMPEVVPGTIVTFACVHQTPELSLRFEVLDAPLAISEHGAAREPFADRIDDGTLVRQTRVYGVAHRTFRLTVLSPPELEGDPMIHRFLTSVRLAP